MAEIDNLSAPNTRAVALEGLRQAFQTRMVQLWTTVTMAGESSPGPRFKKGFTTAVEAYEKAWHAIDENLKE